MFKSNVREIMDTSSMTVRDLCKKTGMSSRTVQRAVKDETIHSCELGTLARIGSALGVTTKQLYDEVEGEAPTERATEKALEII